MDTVISFGGRQCAQREQDTLKMTRMRHSLLKKQYNYYQALVKSTTGYVTTYQVSYHSTISLESFATPAYDLSLSKKNPKRRARPLKIRNIGPHIAKLYSMDELGKNQRHQTNCFMGDCMERSLRTFARRHGQENLL